MERFTPQHFLNNAIAILANQGVSLYEPYQPDGVRWMISREILRKKVKGGFLCDEMGLGKTIQFISLILSNRVPNTLLILPSNLIYQWKSEIKRFAGDEIEVITHHGNTRLIDPSQISSNTCKIVMTSYGMMARYPNSVLHQIKWNRVILEECHLIRNPKSKSSKSVCRLHSDYRWGITGTPIHNSIKDLISLCKFIGIDRNCVMKYKDNIVAKLILRRTKLDVERFNEKLKLPPKEILVEHIPYTSNNEKLFYQKIKGDVNKQMNILSQFNFNMVHWLELVLRLKQAAILPQLVIDGYNKKQWGKTYDDWDGTNTKLDYIVRSVNKYNRERSVIFTQFNYEMNYIYQELTKLGINTKRIHGGISFSERNDIVSQSKLVCDSEDPNYIQCLIVQIQAGGTGLNLQMFDTVWFSTITWNPAVEMQAIARVHRIGQTKPVKIRKVVIQDTIEERILNIQDQKTQIMIDILKDPSIRCKTKQRLTISNLKSMLA
jgi:SNF2 family DNA or RNA helicase